MPILRKIKIRPLTWTPSTDESAVKQSVYIKYGTELSADDTPVLSDLGMDVNKLIIPTDFPDGTFDQDGTYVIGIGTSDETGNESINWVTAPLDITAPLPASNISIG